MYLCQNYQFQMCFLNHQKHSCSLKVHLLQLHRCYYKAPNYLPPTQPSNVSGNQNLIRIDFHFLINFLSVFRNEYITMFRTPAGSLQQRTPAAWSVRTVWRSEMCREPTVLSAGGAGSGVGIGQPVSVCSSEDNTHYLSIDC